MVKFTIRSVTAALAPGWLGVCLVAGTLWPATAQTPAAAKVDRARLEVVEDLSESLANDLLGLSVVARDRDDARLADFFPAELRAAPFWSSPQELRPAVKWISSRAWQPAETDASARQMKAAAFLKGFTAFLDHFGEIEDARFKVKAATFADAAQAVAGAAEPTAVVGATGQARLAFYVIGRNRAGQREWAQGVINATLRYAENKHWQFQALTLEKLESQVARADLFSEVSQPAGVAATRPAHSGGYVWHGAAAGDANNDGWVDLFVTAPDRNYLYLNDGAGKFTDASGATGAQTLASGTAPLFLDYDNDGDEDVFIAAVGSQVMLENRLFPDGRLEFYDVSQEAGVALAAIGFSAVAGDVNNDGYPDIYVTSYNKYGQVVPDSWFRAANGTPNLLFINQKNGAFREAAAAWGVNDSRWSYAAEFNDVNGDGRLDLYVANDFGEKALYVNQGQRFADEAKERGALDPGNGMGVSFGDYDNDGRLDLHTTNMSSTAGNRILARLFPDADPKDNVLKKLAAGNNLYRNLGGGRFQDVTAEVGGFSGGWAWGGGFIDFDNDGWEDLFTPNGFVSGKSMKDT
jgi:hypothetical protein